MPPKYDKDDLGKTLDKLEAQLEKSDPAKEETTADVVKSLANVAEGAIALATDATETRRTKARRKKTVLAKADKDDDDDKDDKDDKDRDEDDDEDEDGDDKPQWLQNLTKDGKAEGEMQYAPNREQTGTHMMTNAGGESRGVGKSFALGQVDTVDVSDYLTDQIAQQRAMTKEMSRLRRLNKSLVDGLTALHERLEVLEEHSQAQARYAAVCAKALGIVLERGEAYLNEPVSPSKFNAMEKSVAHVQAQIDAQGGQVFEMNPRNKERLAKAVLEQKVTTEEATFIKKTQRLPAGVSLN